MSKIYLVYDMEFDSLTEDAVYAFAERGDAEEMILALVQQEMYDNFHAEIHIWSEPWGKDFEEDKAAILYNVKYFTNYSNFVDTYNIKELEVL